MSGSEAARNRGGPVYIAGVNRPMQWTVDKRSKEETAERGQNGDNIPDNWVPPAAQKCLVERACRRFLEDEGIDSTDCPIHLT